MPGGGVSAPATTPRGGHPCMPASSAVPPDSPPNWRRWKRARQLARVCRSRPRRRTAPHTPDRPPDTGDHITTRPAESGSRDIYEEYAVQTTEAPRGTDPVLSGSLAETDPEVHAEILAELA